MSSTLPDPRTSNFQKYQTQNPVMQRIIRRFLDRVRENVSLMRPKSIVDWGCGEGMVVHHLRTLPFSFEYRGFELNPQAVAAARALNPGMSFEQGDLMEMEPAPSSADLVMCLEVIEHLHNPDTAMERLNRWTRDWALISVPWEPYFRMGNFMRGKYLRRFGNHPEHVQHFTPRIFHMAVSRYFPVVRIEKCFPWLIAIARKE